MSAFGVSPFGTGPFGGPGTMTLINVLPVAANEAIAFFDVAPHLEEAFAFSVVNLRNWTLTAIDPSIESTTIPGLVFVPKGEVVPTRQPSFVVAKIDDDDETQVHLWPDAPLEQGVRYEAAVNPLVRGADCEILLGDSAKRFRALRPGPQRRGRFVQEDRFRDWANTLFPTDPKQPEGTWRLEPSTDIALHDEDASLRKRLFRRITARPGDFPHLGRDYGVGIKVKSLARTGNMQELANAIAAQCRREPDVLAVGVTTGIREESGISGIVQVEIFVQRREQRDQRFLFEFPTA